MASQANVGILGWGLLRIAGLYTIRSTRYIPRIHVLQAQKANPCRHCHLHPPQLEYIHRHLTAKSLAHIVPFTPVDTTPMGQPCGSLDRHHIAYPLTRLPSGIHLNVSVSNLIHAQKEIHYAE